MLRRNTTPSLGDQLPALHPTCLQAVLKLAVQCLQAELASAAIAPPSGPQLPHQALNRSAAQQPAGVQQAQHAQQEAQPAVQPVLALLTSGLPPIVLGTFQGDIQRARIILEAAGFLLPLDLSSSLLPGAVQSSPPAHAVHAEQSGLRAVHAECAGPNLPHTVPCTSQEEDGRSEDEEAAIQHALDLSKSAIPQHAEQGMHDAGQQACD